MSLIASARSLAQQLRRSSREVRRIGHRWRVPPLAHAFERRAVARLRADGVFLTSLGEMAGAGIAGSDDIIAAGRRLFASADGGKVAPASPAQSPAESPAESLAKDYLEALPATHLAAEPLLVRWGLQERLLTLAENYIGLPIAYRGLAARRDLANGHQVGTRFWHRDSEDNRIIKIIVYLSDVAAEDGPFCYVPKPASPSGKLAVFDGSRVADEAFDRAVRPADQIACIGPAGTAVFADTCSVWHRGATGRRHDRLTLFFCYNSQMPLAPEHCRALVPLAEWQDMAGLSRRQRAAVNLAY